MSPRRSRGHLDDDSNLLIPIVDVEREFAFELSSVDFSGGVPLAEVIDRVRVRRQAIAGFAYRAFQAARARVLERSERNLEHHELPTLDVAGYPEWTYCQVCGAVGPDDPFLTVALKRVERSERVCDRCADRKADYDGCKTYTAERYLLNSRDFLSEAAGNSGMSDREKADDLLIVSALVAYSHVSYSIYLEYYYASWNP
ncbi:hypothetical protein [Halosolutus gelatinilyticus]|uniref:hypothetical protein n=1 Tax=Halosolutus gelatinilyticus TaxID=2931975 RepID=UPI003CE45006